ncbi:MAG: DUF4383 domain-containing protein [Solirubrobacterales bacterium]
MARTAYTRLYATVSGTLLILLGLAGMLENSEFPKPDLWSELFGFYAANGWASAAHIALGMTALLLAQRISRLWALLAATVFLGLGFWGVLAPNGDLLFGALPATRPVNLINLLFGGFAVAALVASRWDRIRSAVTNREQRLKNRRVERKRKHQLKLRRKRLTTGRTGDGPGRDRPARSTASDRSKSGS